MLCRSQWGHSSYRPSLGGNDFRFLTSLRFVRNDSDSGHLETPESENSLRHLELGNVCQTRFPLLAEIAHAAFRPAQRVTQRGTYKGRRVTSAIFIPLTTDCQPNPRNGQPDDLRRQRRNPLHVETLRALHVLVAHEHLDAVDAALEPGARLELEHLHLDEVVAPLDEMYRQ